MNLESLADGLRNGPWAYHVPKGFEEGCAKSFADVYRRFHKPVLRFIMKKVPNEGVAEEITQEVFLRAFRFKDTYKRELPFSSWIWTIARNAINDHFRKSSITLADMDADYHEMNEVAEAAHPSLHAQCAESLLIDAADRQALIAIMDELPHQQRHALNMRILLKLPYEQISKSMNLSLSAVKSLINRAKTTLVRAHLKNTAQQAFDNG